MWVSISQFTNFSHLFKGLGMVLLASFALLFAYWMDKKWKDPKTTYYYIFVALAVFILLYGMFILVFRPNWWSLPY